MRTSYTTDRRTQHRTHKRDCYYGRLKVDFCLSVESWLYFCQVTSSRYCSKSPTSSRLQVTLVSTHVGPDWLPVTKLPKSLPGLVGGVYALVGCRDPVYNSAGLEVRHDTSRMTLLTYIFMSTLVHQRALQSWALFLYYNSFAVLLTVYSYFYLKNYCY